MSGNSVLIPTSLAKEGNKLASEKLAKMESEFIRSSVDQPTPYPRNAENALLRDRFKNGVYDHRVGRSEDYSLLIIIGAALALLYYYS